MPPTPIGSNSSKWASVRPRMLPLTPSRAVADMNVCVGGIFEMMVGALSSGSTWPPRRSMNGSVGAAGGLAGVAGASAFGGGG